MCLHGLTWRKTTFPSSVQPGPQALWGWHLSTVAHGCSDQLCAPAFHWVVTHPYRKATVAVNAGRGQHRTGTHSGRATEAPADRRRHPPSSRCSLPVARPPAQACPHWPIGLATPHSSGRRAGCRVSREQAGSPQVWGQRWANRHTGWGDSCNGELPRGNRRETRGGDR